MSSTVTLSPLLLCLVFFILTQPTQAVTVRSKPASESKCDKIVPSDDGTPFAIVCKCEAATLVLAVHPFPFVDPNNPQNPPVTLGSRGICSEVQRIPDADGAPASTCSYHTATVVRLFLAIQHGIRKSGCHGG
jgi:hypothetical protein